MAQKITFTFNATTGIGSQTFNLKFNSAGVNYFNQNIIITEFPGPTGSNVVEVGASISDFAVNFKSILSNLLPPINGSIEPFYNRIIQSSNTVEIITGVNTSVDLFLIDDVVTSGLGNTFSTFGTIDRIDYTSNSISLSWSGASDDKGIVGYEVQFRVGASLFWQTPIFISTTFSGGVLDIPTIDSRRDYSFRIRTKDNVGQYSDYKIITAPSSYLRSVSATISCLAPTSVPLYLSKDISLVGLDTIIAYSDLQSTIFNGVNQYWIVSASDSSKYSVFITNLGEVTTSDSCDFLISNTSYRSRNRISLSTTMCSVACVDAIYYSGLIGVGVILYTNSNLLTPFTYTSTTNDYYLIDDVYVCRIDRLTGEINDLRFRSQYCTTTTSGGGGGGCLLEGTEILLSNGDVKNIEDVVIGDEVITYNLKDSCNSIGVVENLLTPLKRNIIKITLSNNIEIRCTTAHPFWCINKKSWVSLEPSKTLEYMAIDISQLSINDKFITSDGIEVYVLDIQEIISDYITTYDISVIPDNNYFANDILVHNKIMISTDPLYLP